MIAAKAFEVSDEEEAHKLTVVDPRNTGPEMQ